MAGLLTDFGLGGVGRVSLLPCGFGWNNPVILGIHGPAIHTQSGACVANTWKTVLSVSGAAVRLNALMLSLADATARTVKLRITIDGVVVFDASQAATSAVKLVAVGQVVSNNTFNSVTFQPVDAGRSLLVEYQSNLTETDKVAFSYNYEVR